MRLYSLLLASALSFPAYGDEILAKSRITSVTLYPQGAMISRAVEFEAPTGAHVLLLTDLPQNTYAEAVRVAGNEAVKPGAVWLRDDRLFARPEPLSPAQEAAQLEIDAAQAGVDAAADALASVQAGIEAANAEIAFLSAIGPDVTALTPESLTALSGAVAQGITAARARAIAAGAQARPLEKALADAAVARDLAQQAYDALPMPDGDYAALSVAVDVAAQGPQVLTLTQFIEDAGWAPVYDLTLKRANSASLTLARGAIVAQYSGEDWTGVGLTLSTARPSDQTDPSVLYPDYREIYDPEEEAKLQRSAGEAEMADAMVMAEAAPMAAGMSVATAELQGDVWVYQMPGAVSIASGVENLRLALDEVAFAPEIRAQAVPRLDSVAYMVAKFTNTSGEILLPGMVNLYRDTNLVGRSQIPLLAAGEEWTQGFGAIDGLVLEREMPEVSEGERGILSSETELSESAILRVKNLTAEAWAVRMIDQIPYSEQEDLDVLITSFPAPDEFDLDGQRGILAWEFDLAPGAEKEVTLGHSLRWPSGMALR